jgi:hypothetical protein
MQNGLDGIRAIDLTEFEAETFWTQMLAGFGARMIKTADGPITFEAAPDSVRIMTLSSVAPESPLPTAAGTAPAKGHLKGGADDENQ